MIGYGPESHHFVLELTYNYGLKPSEVTGAFYELGNDLQGITLRSNGILAKARELNYPIQEVGGKQVLTAPDGYRFYLEETSDGDSAVKEVQLSCTNLETTIKYWQDTLGMQLLEKGDKTATLSFQPEKGFALKFLQLDQPLNRAAAYGRIAFAVPWDEQPVIDEKIKACNGSILTPLITLDTPGKATVRVIILGDPDGHEICFVDEEGFSQLSQVDEASDSQLDKYVKKDPFQK